MLTSRYSPEDTQNMISI